MWAHRMQRVCCLHYIDNEAARCGLIKGYSPVRDNAFLNQLFWGEESKSMVFSWFDKVPCPSNIADPPSRGVEPPALKLGHESRVCKKVSIPVGIQESWVDQWASYARLGEYVGCLAQGGGNRIRSPLGLRAPFFSFRMCRGGGKDLGPHGGVVVFGGVSVAGAHPWCGESLLTRPPTVVLQQHLPH